jgi:predicted DNA-binding transcriptional regulator AlpA
MPTNIASHEDRLIDRPAIGALFGLGRTAVKALLARPDAPAPIVVNARVYRYRESDVLAFLERLRPAPHGAGDAATETGSTPATSRRAGRPRKHTVSPGVLRHG